MKIVVCPDAYKGTFSSAEIAGLIEDAIKSISPEHEVVLMPVSDGGEGFIDVWRHVHGGEMIASESLNSDGEPLLSRALITTAKLGVLESASSCGITHIGPKHSVLTATSRGLGIDIKNLVNKGINRIAVGLGGSATNDGGAGALFEMGVRFWNHQRESFLPSGGNLDQILDIDTAQADDLLNNVELSLFTDVTNPLTGPRGASQVFARQKGASAKEIGKLESNMIHYERLLQEKGIDTTIQGMGAAGGIAAGLSLLGEVKLVSGITAILEALKAPEIIKDAGLVITGEGRLDSQSFSGKVLTGLISITKGKNIELVSLPAKASLEGIGLAKQHGIGCLSVFPYESPVIGDLSVVKKRLYELIESLLVSNQAKTPH